MRKKLIYINGYRSELFTLAGLTTVRTDDDDTFVVELGYPNNKPKIVNKLYHTIGLNRTRNRIYMPKI